MHKESKVHQVIFMALFTWLLNLPLRHNIDEDLQVCAAVGGEPAEDAFLTLTEYENAHCADP